MRGSSSTPIWMRSPAFGPTEAKERCSNFLLNGNAARRTARMARLCGRRHPRPARLARASCSTKIDAELRQRPARKVLLVFVGDLIDRGPSSAQVIERLRTYRRAGVQTGLPPRQSRRGAASNPRGRGRADHQMALVRRGAMPRKLWGRVTTGSPAATNARRSTSCARRFPKEHRRVPRKLRR